MRDGKTDARTDGQTDTYAYNNKFIQINELIYRQIHKYTDGHTQTHRGRD